MIIEEDESLGEKTKNILLKNKRKRKNENEIINISEYDVGSILNIPEYLSKITSSSSFNLNNSDIILFILELCLNSSQFELMEDNSSRKFWEDVGKIKQLSPIIKIFKTETLRKYWRLLRNINNPKKIIDAVNEFKNLINNENIKLLSSINIICDYVLFPKKGINYFINKYCGKALNKLKKERNVKDMDINEQIDELINGFKEAFPGKKKEEILEKLYKNNFDIKNTYLVLKDEINFGYLSFNKKEDEMILDKNISDDKYKELALKKGHINIIKRQQFLEGNFDKN